MEEVESELEVRGTPVFMRLRRTLPMVTMRLGGSESQWKNTQFPQFSWDFAGNSPIFFGFCRVFAWEMRFWPYFSWMNARNAKRGIT
jgi:hypothetical protein